MRITMSVTRVDINVAGHMNKVRSDKFWTFAASEWHRLYKDYVPMREGILYGQVTITPKQIEHTAPYAHYIYEGRAYGPNYPITQGGAIVGFFSQPNRPKKPTGKTLQYSRQLHPKASRHWDKAAAPTQKPKLVQSMQRFVDGGGLNLSG